MRTAKHSYSGALLLRYLIGEEGCTIFTPKQAEKAAHELHIRSSYVSELLHYLCQEGWIERLKRGLYAINSDSGFGSAPHEYEVALALVTPSAISHWTAMHQHNLTQQVPNKVFAMTTTGTPVTRSIDKDRYHYVRTQPDHYFGFETIWIDEAKILITDLERTLLDGLISPQHCGDFQEVLYGFQTAHQRMNLQKIIDYALRLDAAVVKRLGWVLEHLGYDKDSLNQLQALSIKGFRKLDASAPPEGPYNKVWMIQENI